MSDPVTFKAQGILREGWTAAVDDYALVCDWALGGDILLVADVSGTISAFEGTSGRLLWRKDHTHKGGLLVMAVHPDGKRVASAGQDGGVALWEVGSGTKLGAMQIASAWVEHLAWSPDGSCLAATCSRTALVFNSSGKEIWRSEEHPSTVSAIVWSEETELATACYGRVTFYDINKHKVSQSLEWQGSLVSMILSPDGEIVACGSQDKSVHFWRRSTAEDAMMSGYPAKPSSLAFDDSGTLLATSGSEVVTVWSFDGEGPEGTRPGELDLHGKPITCLAFAPTGMRLASGSKDGSVVVWLLNSDGDGGVIGAALTGDPISSLKWRPDGCALVATTAQGCVTSWRVGK